MATKYHFPSTQPHHLRNFHTWAKGRWMKSFSQQMDALLLFNLFCDDLISAIHWCYVVHKCVMLMPSLSARLSGTFTESKSVHIRRHANYYVMTDDCWRFFPFRILLSDSCIYPSSIPHAPHSALVTRRKLFFFLYIFRVCCCCT